MSSALLLYDHGENLPLALRLAQSGHRVGYHVPRTTEFWSSKIGTGYESQGVERVDDFWQALDKGADKVFVFGSNQYWDGDLVEYLKKQSYDVFGTGWLEVLEMNRWRTKQYQQANGLPVNKCELVVGVPKLLKLLETTKDKIVKVSEFRDLETFKHDDWATTAEQHLPKLLNVYGMDETIEFVVEDPIKDDLECGVDDIVINDQHLLTRCYGYEEKDNCYVGHLVPANKVPPRLDRVSKAMTQGASKNHTAPSSYFMSTEVRGDVLIDITMRTPRPPVAGMMMAYTRIDDILVNKNVAPGPTKRYCASLMLYSPYNVDHPVKVDIDKSKRWMLHLDKSYVSANGDEFVVPNKDGLLGHIALAGDSLSVMIDALKLTAKEVKAKDLTCDVSGFDRLVEEVIPKGKLSGIQF